VLGVRAADLLVEVGVEEGPAAALPEPCRQAAIAISDRRQTRISGG
jgi:glycyl-tRNA synthetase beta subunit